MILFMLGKVNILVLPQMTTHRINFCDDDDYDDNNKSKSVCYRPVTLHALFYPTLTSTL